MSLFGILFFGASSLPAYPFPQNQTPEVHLKTFETQKSKPESNMKKGKAKKALDNLKILLRYNPFDPELILLRIKLEEELGSTAYSAYDQELLKVLDIFK